VAGDQGGDAALPAHENARLALVGRAVVEPVAQGEVAVRGAALVAGTGVVAVGGNAGHAMGGGVQNGAERASLHVGLSSEELVAGL
jgi:hypothetical protein